MSRYILAHDLGTTGNKATLYDQAGSLVGSAISLYDTEYAHPGWAEQDPNDWWRAICSSTHALRQQANARPQDIACIVFSGQMMGCAPLDKRARPLRQAIIWADQRAVEQVRRLEGRIASGEVYQITGHRLGPSYSLSKILWLRDHQPGIFQSAHKFVQAKDAMVARLTGVFATDPSDASGMNLYDLEAGQWSSAMLEAAELDPRYLPDVYPSTEVVGEVLPQVAEEAGVAAGTPVVIGGGDGACAAAGAGAVREGPAYNYIGSSSWIALSSQQPIYDPDYKTFTFCHIVPGMFMPIGTMQTAGTSYQWMRNNLCPAEVAEAQAIGMSPYDVMNQLAEQSPLGADGLVFLPYLLGERSPRWNTNARGAFVGLTIRHTRADMIRAVLEGISLNLRVILDALQNQGAGINAMRLIGGGARGHFWSRLLADIYGLPVHRLAILEEATSMGAALAGGIGIGFYPDFAMSERMNPTSEVIEPDPATHAAYNELLPIFEATYQALVPVFDQIAARDKH